MHETSVDPSNKDPIELERLSREQAGEKRSFWPHATWPMIVGGALVAMSLIVEHLFQVFSGASGGKATYVVTPKMAVIFLAELGFAFIIAYIVSLVVERQASKKLVSEISLEHRSTLLGVIARVYQIDHGEEYVKAVLRTCFGSKFIREDYTIFHKLDPLSPEEIERLGVDVERFIRVTSQISYKVINKASTEEHLFIVYGLPFRSEPEAVRAFPRALTMRVGDKSYTEEDLAKLAKDDLEYQERDYTVSQSVPAAGSLQVDISAVMIKEVSDSDTFGFLQPTTNVTLRLESNVKGLQLGATARTVGKMEERRRSPDGRSYEWKIRDSVIPYNSVIFWWRRLATDRADQDGQAVSASVEH